MWAKIFIFVLTLNTLLGQSNMYVSGVAVVRFRRGVVDLPLDNEKGGLEVIQDTVIRGFLARHNFIEIERAITDFSPAETLTTLENGEIVKVPDFSLIFKLKFPIETDVISLCDTLRDLPNIEWVHPDFYLMLNGDPNDVRFPEQWALFRIGCPNAWNYEVGRSNVKIAIIDNGIKYDHPDLGGGFGSGFKVVGGYDFIDNDNDPYDPGAFPHGTHVAGIASALTNNNIGIAGISGGWGSSNKGCLLYACRSGTSTQIASAIIKAAKPVSQGGYGCRVLNCSMGWPYESGFYPIPIVEREALIYAYKCQRNFVAAKGNRFYDNYYERWWTPPFINFPSDFEPHLVLSVGATGADDYRCSWSNYGNGIDVVAPGEDILSTWMPSGNEMYHLASGTSMATPHVSGLASLIWSEAQELGIPLLPEEVEGIICASARDDIPLTPPGYDDEYGWGRIQADRALAMLHYPYRIEIHTANWQSGNPYINYFPYANALEIREHWVYPDGTYECDNIRKLKIPLPQPSAAWVKPFLVGLRGDPYTGSATVGYSFSPYYTKVERILFGFYLHCEPYAGITKDGNNWYGITYTYHIKLPNNVWDWIPAYPNQCLIHYAIIGAYLYPPNLQKIYFVTPSTMRIQWLYQHGVEDGFYLEKKVGEGAWTVVDGHIPPSSNPYIPVPVYFDDQDFVEGQIYHYRVYATHGTQNRSDYSQVLSKFSIRPPSEFSVSQPTPTTVLLRWKDNSEIETQFQIARKVDNGPWNESYKFVSASPGSGGIIQWTDNIEFLHNYSYKVRAYYNSQYQSDWCDSLTIIALLAQSDYSKMSAYNNGAKVAKYGNNLYVAYTVGDWGCGTRHVYCLRSTDG
ncbi:MAG: S8 family serine peptidase, partial [candidate division WOR-3 bacterium]